MIRCNLVLKDLSTGEILATTPIELSVMPGDTIYVKFEFNDEVIENEFRIIGKSHHIDLIKRQDYFDILLAKQ